MDFQGEDIWVATALGLSHGIREPQKENQLYAKATNSRRYRKTSQTSRVRKTRLRAPDTLNEAYDYPKPSSFSRGLRLDIKGITILLISGTASIDDRGVPIHLGDFRAQTKRTYENITKLLKAEGATWKDIVRTTCYLRDIERDYEAFNEERTAVLQGTGSQSPARLHRHPGDSVPPGIAD